jgi:hypothetical protein
MLAILCGYGRKHGRESCLSWLDILSKLFGKAGYFALLRYLFWLPVCAGIIGWLR